MKKYKIIINESDGEKCIEVFYLINYISIDGHFVTLSILNESEVVLLLAFQFFPETNSINKLSI